MLVSPDAELGYGLAAFLGAVQGVAEFLPISSSGHLSLFEAWLGVDAEAAGHSFNIVVHAGTLLAVLLVFREDLLGLLRGLFDPQRVPWARPTLLALIVGSLPLGVVLIPGVEELVVQMEGQVRAIGVALLVTAAMLGFTHRKEAPLDERDEPPSWRAALVIGVAQLVAVVPGISRSGSTIAAALALGLGRARAARFSFLLSIPAITAATGKEALDLLTGDVPVAIAAGPFAVGFVCSFLVGLAALRLLLALIEKLGLLPFVPYLVLVGALAVILG
ncbi:undecaprenyl-diphosphate phosphatase [Pseudenhygromyxa sp. WMMC2535]|uniref:undecaprenyl-diphosphate phosphatase n=1 Tax=Pseudenhygromyxa sp. WMMC2535 TaxID=2712867 RepID=UPI001554AE70|nr:undecaprenyl-diphosphate phosphatase [Pseudenhygromyxa sp. WMMC2535]NVB39683.1 undecaprenyl-diphosphate phosphatase [Pseudenhygromyxa sp. WMMC2535]